MEAKYPDAATTFERSVKLLADAISVEGTTPDKRWELSMGYYGAGVAYQLSREREKAQAAFRECVKLRRELPAVKDPAPAAFSVDSWWHMPEPGTQKMQFVC